MTSCNDAAVTGRGADSHTNFAAAKSLPRACLSRRTTRGTCGTAQCAVRVRRARLLHTRTTSLVENYSCFSYRFALPAIDADNARLGMHAFGCRKARIAAALACNLWEPFAGEFAEW